MQNFNNELVNTNDAIEELKSSVNNIDQLSKTLKSLSVQLSYVADKCEDVYSVSNKLQSHVCDMLKSLRSIENKKQNEPIDNMWLYKQQLSFKPLLSLPTSPFERNLTSERCEQTFKKYLLGLNELAARQYQIENVNPYQVLFNLLVIYQALFLIFLAFIFYK